MQKRGIILLWPLWLAPLAAILAVKLSGPTYTEAPNQDAMVIRFLALFVWFFIATIGAAVTLLSMKPKSKMEYLESGCSVIASLFIFFVISITMK